VPTDVARDFSAAGGVPDQDRVPQLELFNEGGEIIGIGVHVVAVPGLARTAMATTIVSDRAISVGCKKDELLVPGVGIEGPAVPEDNRLPFAQSL
jgi:hypothetical protein